MGAGSMIAFRVGERNHLKTPMERGTAREREIEITDLRDTEPKQQQVARLDGADQPTVKARNQLHCGLGVYAKLH